jgi:hypothetical protein
LDSDSEFPIKAIVDVEEQQLRLLNAERIYKCGNCDFVSLSQNYIIRFHTREAHSGLSPSFREIPSHIAMRGELQFSKSHPERTKQSDVTANEKVTWQTVSGKVAADKLSVAGAKQRWQDVIKQKKSD